MHYLIAYFEFRSQDGQIIESFITEVGEVGLTELG